MAEDQETETTDDPEVEIEVVEDDDESEEEDADNDRTMEIQDLRTIVGHYLPDMDIDDLLENHFSRSGKFIPPTVDTPAEEKAKPKPRRELPFR